MKTNYIILFDDRVETYCKTLSAAKTTVDEMIEDYSCEGLSAKTIRKDTKIYKVTEVKLI